MSSDIAIKVENLSKCYHIYDQPHDRLKQLVLPRLGGFVGLRPKQYYQEFWALRDVSFEVKKGETVGIIGRNGSGKSTLLQMICGTLNPTSGSIQTKGRIAALLELGSGFNPEFTGRENVYMNGAVLGLSREEIDARFDAIAAFADIGQFIEQPVKTYSSGMMVRLAFSVAINVDPEILIVDEALSVGDELFQRKCFSRIEAIRSSGSTIVFVSHSGGQIVELCNRAILLDEGEKIIIGPPKEVVGLYYKLLYAPAIKKSEIRIGISKEYLSLSDVLAIADVDRDLSSTSKDDVEESFDPHLLPSSTIEYESHGPLIQTPSLLTLNGDRVNGLVRGKRYRYSYRVVFNKSASQVRFGMSIKTSTGFSLGGALTASSLGETLAFVGQGESINVEFTFGCYLNPGVYFMNAGVFGGGVKSGEEIVLHRIADVIAFRVLPIANNLETEVVSFGFEPLVLLNQ